MSLLFLSCAEQPSIVRPSTINPEIVIPTDPRYSYIFAEDSLFKNWLPDIFGSTPVSGGFSFNNFIYDISTIPDTCWVWRIDHELNLDEDCKLVGEKLYCPSDTDFIDWQICCPDTLGFNRNAKRSSSSSF